MTMRSLVITVHGVETLGEWQEEVRTSFAGIDGLHYEPHKYGVFRVFRIFCPFARRREVRRFAEFYDRFCKDSAIRPSIIAHSFGTYIVTTALRRHKRIQFDRVILCGSIVAKDYPWRELLRQGKVSAVRNELANEDRVVSLLRLPFARRLLPGTGTSGIDGFDDPPAEVSNEGSDYTHSEHFLMLGHCNRYWRPFIRRLEEFTELCFRCAANDADAWRAFHSTHTPGIRRALVAIFPSQSDQWYEGQLAALVYLVAKHGCEGAHDAESLALTLCLEIRNAIAQRQ